MATLSVVQQVLSGILYAPVSVASGGDLFPNTGKEVFLIENTHSSSSRDVTVVTDQKVEGLTVADLTKTVAAGEIRSFGPFRQAAFSATDKKVRLTYSASGDSLKIFVLKITPVS